MKGRSVRSFPPRAWSCGPLTSWPASASVVSRSPGRIASGACGLWVSCVALWPPYRYLLRMGGVGGRIHPPCLSTPLSAPRRGSLDRSARLGGLRGWALLRLSPEAHSDVSGASQGRAVCPWVTGLPSAPVPSRACGVRALIGRLVLSLIL